MLGGYAVASALRWKGADIWAKANMKDIYLNEEVAGKEKSGGGLTWIQKPGRFRYHGCLKGDGFGKGGKVAKSERS